MGRGLGGWRIDHDTQELVGRCGCRLPNTPDGMSIALAHRHAVVVAVLAVVSTRH